MDLSKMLVGLSSHAYSQYCDRVKLETYDDVRTRLRELIADRKYHRADQFMEVDGVWWVYQVDGNEVSFVTCYGSSNLDIPRAMRWARQHNDRIDLSNSQALGILGSGWT